MDITINIKEKCIRSSIIKINNQGQLNIWVITSFTISYCIIYVYRW